MLSILKKVCHQKPERSILIKNRKIPLCARCLGFYTGLIFGLLLYFFEIYKISLEQIIILLVITILPMAIDGTTQFLGKRESNNKLRLFTGILCGIGTGIGFIFVLKN